MVNRTPGSPHPHLQVLELGGFEGQVKSARDRGRIIGGNDQQELKAGSQQWIFLRPFWTYAPWPWRYHPLQERALCPQLTLSGNVLMDSPRSMSLSQFGVYPTDSQD